MRAGASGGALLGWGAEVIEDFGDDSGVGEEGEHAQKGGGAGVLSACGVSGTDTVIGETGSPVDPGGAGRSGRRRDRSNPKTGRLAKTLLPISPTISPLLGDAVRRPTGGPRGLAPPVGRWQRPQCIPGRTLVVQRRSRGPVHRWCGGIGSVVMKTGRPTCPIIRSSQVKLRRRRRRTGVGAPGAQGPPAEPDRRAQRHRPHRLRRPGRAPRQVQQGPAPARPTREARRGSDVPRVAADHPPQRGEPHVGVVTGPKST